MCGLLCGRCSHRSAKRSSQRKGLVAILGPVVKRGRLAVRRTVVEKSIQALRIARIAQWTVSGKLGPIAFVISPIFGSIEWKPFTFFKKDRQRRENSRHDASDDGTWIVANLQPVYGSLDAAVIRTSPHQGINIAHIVWSVLSLFAKRAKFG